MECLVMMAQREGYSKAQVRWTMTVGELIEMLQDYDPELPIYLSHDSGYTYGGVREGLFEVQEVEE